MPSSGSDVVVVGAGLSGLIVAILMAETGRRVVVLEQHAVPGGYLQQFSRRGTTFDVGFHYVGQTLPGRPMRRMLEHLDVWRRLDARPLPDDAAIVVRDGGDVFGIPSRFDRFVEKCTATFPSERRAIEALAAETDALCDRFRWFALRPGSRDEPPDGDAGSFESFVAPRIGDPRLRRLLGLQSFNLGLSADEIPWTKHALAFRSCFDLTSRFAGGGGALVAALTSRAAELGVDLRLKTDVVRYECADRRVVAVRTADGARHEAGLFFAACHPKAVMNALGDEDIGATFRDRVQAMRESRGALQVFYRLSARPRSVDTCLLVRDEAEARVDPPLPVVLIVVPPDDETSSGGGPRVEAMTYLDQAPFARWAGLRAMARGAEYEQLKSLLADRVTAVVERALPGFADLVIDRYASTPATDEWYTRNAEGGVFGVSHDVSQQGFSRPQSRTRLRNLLFTGHSIHMPGICGTAINAFETCDRVLGGELFKAVAR